MKSWKKLRVLTRFKEKVSSVEQTQDVEEITKGMQEVQHMKTQYEGFHAVSSRVVSRAYGFSEAIQELASFLINTFGLDNGEINQVYKEVARVQFELSRLLRLYAFHVSGTLTLPMESLLNELGHIEDTKKQYDEKRVSFDLMRFKKSKVKSGKLEGHVDQLLQESKEQFDELAMFLECRLHSLEQSRPRNLITQAVRHHAAQMHLFSQGLGCLDEVDPYIARVVHDRALDQSLDYLDGDNGAVFDCKTKETDETEDRSSSSEQEASPSKQFEDQRSSYVSHQEPTGSSRSAPISPIRFADTNGVNSIHEVLLDGVSKKLPAFSRTNSWLRRKGSRDPGVLHLYKPGTSQQQSLAYSVTEPASSPGPTWTRSPQHLSNQQRYQQAQQQQQQAKLSSFPNFHRPSAKSGPLISSSAAAAAAAAAPKPRLIIPGSGPLPQPPPSSSSQTLPVDPLYKSGPLNPSPKISPNVSPSYSSPPRGMTSELHKLPPPPLSCSGASTSVVAPPPSAAKLIPHSAPLVRPQQNQSPGHHLHHQQQQNQSPGHHLHHQQQQHSQASPLPPPPLGAQAPSPGWTKHHKGVKKNEERVSPLPTNLSPNNNA